MGSTAFCSSIAPSSALFCRIQIPIPNFSDESAPSAHRFLDNEKRRQKEVGFLKVTVAEAVETTPIAKSDAGLRESQAATRKLRVLVAGGGIGGLVFALAAKKKGFEVLVLEKDLSAIRGEGQYRGPIQLQSSALAALEAIDMDVAEQVIRLGCITGDRVNGICDGVSGNWYVKFDTFTTAAERGLPLTRAISRMTLQQILAQAIGQELIKNESNVVSFKDEEHKVTVMLENGGTFEGDVLVGADGIWSMVRKNLFGHQDAVYSGYTCYTGITDFVPADIDSVGYRVFLGHRQYFVSSDVGGGKMQWYAFHKEDAGGVDAPHGKKERLMKIFGDWCDNVTDLILATDEEAILRRDIYDRTPTFNWGKGRVTLLGDSVHAMQPNMGQGGCMAIEDSYQLSLELYKVWKESIQNGKPIDIVSSLKRYESARRIRVAAIHGMARMAAAMASAYTAYLGEGLGPLSFITKFRIPHPGIAVGRFLIDKAMPLMLSWVLGGYSSNLEGRSPQCRLSDKADDQLRKWFEDDDALERAIKGDWFLLPLGDATGASQPICLKQEEDKTCIIGRVINEDQPGISVALPFPQVSERHAQISFKNGAFYVTDLQSQYGTWIINNEGRRNQARPNVPTRFHPSNVIEFGTDQKASFRVKVLKTTLMAAAS